jgi:hypothetical protein
MRIIQKCAPVLAGTALAQCEASPATCSTWNTPRECRTRCERAVKVLSTECYILLEPGPESLPYFHPVRETHWPTFSSVPYAVHMVCGPYRDLTMLCRLLPDKLWCTWRVTSMLWLVTPPLPSPRQ